MKETGITRRVDELGRIVVPSELRRVFGINPGDALDVSVDGDAIILRKVSKACVFCDGVVGLRTYRGQGVCSTCIAELADGGRPADSGEQALERPPPGDEPALKPSG